MATHSSILAWRIPWTEEPGRVQPIGSQRVIHDWRDLAHTPVQALKHYTEIKWLILSPTALMNHTDIVMSEKMQIPKYILWDSYEVQEHTKLSYRNRRYQSGSIMVWKLMSVILKLTEYSGRLELLPIFILILVAHAKLLQLCPTLCNSVDCSPPGSSVHGLLQARIMEWVDFSFSRGSSQLRDQTHVSYVSCVGRWVLYH